MTLLILFVSLFIGINLRFSIVFGLIETILWILFIIYRFGKKSSIIPLIFVLIGVSFSFINPSFQKETYKSVVIEVKENYFIASSTFEKLYVYEKEHGYEIGDILDIRGEKVQLDFVSLESEFDFTEYLNKKGVYSEIKYPEIHVLFSNPLKIHKLKKNFLNRFDENARNLISNILFGENLRGEINDSISSLQIYKYFSNSGFFLHAFTSFICFIFLHFFKKKYAKLTSIIFLLFYSIFTFPRPVVIKFTLSSFLSWINEFKLNKKYRNLEITSFLGIAFLILDYHYALQDSFSIIFFLPILVQLINSSFRGKKTITKKVIISLFAFLFFIPYQLKFNNCLNLFSPVVGFLFSPIMLIFNLLTILSFFGVPIQIIINNYSNWIGTVLKALSKISINIYSPPLNMFEHLIYVVLLIALFYLISINFKPLLKINLVILVSLTAFIFVPINNYVETYVSFINVGQGDSCHIHSKNIDILIDTGGLTYKDVGTEVLIPYFKKNKIYDIDLLITTHDDFDHSGCVSSLINNFKVKKYVNSYNDFPLKIGDISLTNYNYYFDSWNEENDESLVIGMELKGIKFLFTGDAPKKIENLIIKDNKDLDIDILKVGHHGSITSTGEDFIKLLTPKEAVISVGKNNKYGHPDDKILSLLRKYKIVIRRTDIEGTIKYIL